MAGRPQKVSTDLFASTENGSPAAKEAQPEETPPQRQTRQRRRTPTTKPPALPEGRKGSVSFYFSPETNAQLEEAWFTLRQQAAAHDVAKSKVSKSAIVELAVLAAIQDLEQNGDKSMLASILAH